MNKRIVEELADSGLELDRFAGKKILITGANGLIASGLTDTLMYLNDAKKLNMGVYALCRNRYSAKKRFEAFTENELFHLLIQDVVQPLQCNVVFDYIFHAASAAHPGAFNTVPVDVMKANLVGTINLLDYCIGKKTRFVFISSSEIYGENFEHIDVWDEDMYGSVDTKSFRSCYSEGKRAAETLCMSYKKQFGVNALVVRPAFIYGRDVIDTNIRADVQFLKDALEHRNIVMYSSGMQVRSYLYINDCVSAMMYIALRGENGEVYNIGDDECAISLHDYAQTLASAAGVELIYKPESKPKDLKLLKTTRCVLSSTKLKELGWRPVYSLEEGMKDIFGEA